MLTIKETMVHHHHHLNKHKPSVSTKITCRTMDGRLSMNAGHGAPGGYTFQYSNCTGKRKALLIGINYFGQRGQLRGCINDVKNMSGYLNQHFGYKREDMVLLTDDQQNPMSQPTKANILRAMHWLVKDAQPNDSLFFHYSGHGGQTKDLDGDEEDGYDEVIYPVDFRTAGHIVDDEMHRIMYVSSLLHEHPSNEWQRMY
jgi:hypothetical protein